MNRTDRRRSNPHVEATECAPVEVVGKRIPSWIPGSANPSFNVEDAPGDPGHDLALVLVRVENVPVAPVQRGASVIAEVAHPNVDWMREGVATVFR